MPCTKNIDQGFADDLGRESNRIEDIVDSAVDALLAEGFNEPGQSMVVVAGVQLGCPGSTGLPRMPSSVDLAVHQSRTPLPRAQALVMRRWIGDKLVAS